MTPTPKASVAAPEAGRVGKTTATSASDLVNKIDMALHDAIGMTDVDGPLRKHLEAIHIDVHDLAVDVAALRDEGEVPAGEWQDIETAPKDGTKILAFGNMRAFLTDRIFIARWERDVAGGVWMGPQWRCIPTHWRPLPTPPAQIATTTKDSSDGQ